MRALRPVLAAALLVLALAGCSREFGPDTSSPGGEVSATAQSARTKLALQLQDACYAGDPRAAWPRCGRWVEETSSTARTATGALPADPAVTDAVARIAAGRDTFAGRGCSAPGSGAAPDPGGCVGGLGQVRDGVRALAGALRVPGA